MTVITMPLAGKTILMRKIEQKKGIEHCLSSLLRVSKGALCSYDSMLQIKPKMTAKSFSPVEFAKSHYHLKPQLNYFAVQ